MKLTFADSPGINELNFKRLLLLSNELAFFDWPSINLAGSFGSVGQKSPLANFIKDLKARPLS